MSIDYEKIRIIKEMEFNQKFESFVLNFQEKIDVLSSALEQKDEELKLTKQILIHNSKMAMMGEMIDSIAHQWKQPLGIISLRSSFIKEALLEDDILDKEILDDFSTDITRQVRHLVDTLNEFRSFFRPNYNIQQLNLDKLLNSVSLLLKDDLIAHNVTLEINQNDEGIYLWANENDIKHLFINLINNAKDEMAKSNIKLEKRVVNISYAKKDTHVEILVKDNGTGIKESILKHIFRPNFTTKENSGGTGMGLYICKQIVQKYNGKISVYNDNGAVFKIQFETYENINDS